VAIREIVEAIQKAVTDGMAADSLAPPDFAFGEEGIAVEGTPPRIVFFPGDEEFGPPEGNRDQITNPRPLFTRKTHLLMHIWGEDTDEVEVLLNRLSDAIHGLVFGSWRLVGGTWRRNQADASRLGVVYVLIAEIKIPVVRAMEVSGPVETIPITPVISPIT
jgi:hypothetical protein